MKRAVEKLMLAYPPIDIFSIPTTSACSTTGASLLAVERWRHLYVNPVLVEDALLKAAPVRNYLYITFYIAL
jgi:hypothetical protein